MVLTEIQSKHEGKNVVDSFFLKVERWQNKPLVYYRHQESYVSKSYLEMRESVYALASYLVSIGVRKGDKIAIYSVNCWEWWVSDLAILSVGGVSVPIYPTNSADETKYVLDHAEVSVCMVGNEDQRDKLLGPKRSLRGLKKIITFFDGRKKGIVLSINDAFALGKKAGKEKEADRRRKLIKEKDLAVIVYTSGTTGNPKGVMLSHGNIFSNVMQLIGVFGKYLGEDDRFLSFLPLSHALEHTAGFHTVIALNSSLAFAEHIRTVSRDLQEIQPTVIISVPRLFEKIHAGVISTVNAMPLPKRLIIKWALRIGRKNIPNLCANRPARGFLALMLAFAEKNVFSVLRKEIGFSRNIVAISGGGPLTYADAQFFLSIGINLFEGYGLSEASPVTNVNHVGRIKLGTVGTPMRDTRITLSDEGEILIKGPQVMQGYYKDKSATKEVFTKDGWLKTGDLGILDENGFLTITGRIKDIIITAGGKNISPQNIESALMRSRYIENIAIIGDRRKFLSALIIPDFAELEIWAKRQGLVYSGKKDMVRNQDVIRLYAHEIESIMKNFARVEQVRRFAVLDDVWGIESGELTPTLKVKRRSIEAKYAELIESLYRE
jgi:long-chain acyl-CoA synthetase